MKKIKLFPFYNNNLLETADEVADFLIKASPSNHYHNINTVSLSKEAANTTVIVPTNRVKRLLKFFIILSFKNKLNDNKNNKTAAVPNIKTINEVVDEFCDFAVTRLFKENSGETLGGKQIINYEDKNIIIYDILKGFQELPQENPGAVFSLSDGITSLLNDFYSYNVDTEKLYDELTGKGPGGSRLPSLSDLIYGYEGIEKQFNLILKADKAYKDRLKDLNLIDSGLLMSSFVNADANDDDSSGNNTGINSATVSGNGSASKFVSDKNKFKPLSNSVFNKHYKDKNIFVALINDLPPVHIKFLNKLKDNANNFTIILPYIYPDFKKDVHPGYSIYVDFIAKMSAGIDEIKIKEHDAKNSQFNVKIDIANSLFTVAKAKQYVYAGDGESGHSESKSRKEEKTAEGRYGNNGGGSSDSKGGFRKWDNARVVSGLTVEDEVKNVCILIKKDILSGIKPREIIVVLMEKSYAVPVYSAFLEFGFEANLLVPLNAFNDKDVLYFYKALEMANNNFNYKNIINFLYLRDNNRDIIDYIIHVKDKLNISDGKDNLSNLINYTEKSGLLNNGLDLKKSIMEKLKNFKEYVYIDADKPLSFEEFSGYLNKLAGFLFQPGLKSQTQSRRGSFINQVMETMAYYDVLLNDRFLRRTAAGGAALQHPKNGAYGRRGALYELKFNFKEYFLLITKFFENYEIPLKARNAGITVMGKLEGRYSFAKSAYIMGFSEDYFPAERPKDYLLTPKIKERLGMPSYEKLELFQKSHFLSYMMLFNTVTFSYPESIQGKKRLKSPYLFFIEDKLTNCEINGAKGPDGLNLVRKINDDRESAEEYAEVFNKITRLENIYADNLDEDTDISKGKKIDIFKQFQIHSVSPKAIYDYVKCGYKFYLDDIAKIEKAGWDFDEKSPLIFGVIIHAAMKKFLDSEIKPLIESGSSDSVKFLKVREIKMAPLFNKFKEIILNEPGFNLLSYSYIEHTNKILGLIFPKFLKNLFDKVKKYGFNKLDTELERVREISFEENHNFKSVKLKGRIDLILSRAGRHINLSSAKEKNIAWIYDFKTGYLQKSGFAKSPKSFIDNLGNNIKDDNIKNAGDYLSSIQLYTYAYMLDDEYNVLGGSYILLSNSLEAQKTGYIKDIQYAGAGVTGNSDYVTKLLIEQIISGKNKLLPNLSSKDNCRYCDYVNICY
ncbi:MAG: PD-(D/E)XK nuclease family protein [Deltaproteobacteria bacterium]|nr:PD-(D/E)XK nuclease family protein [Deltaproteobacteria bacterium]